MDVPPKGGSADPPGAYWSVEAGDLARALRSGDEGLSGDEARSRLEQAAEERLPAAGRPLGGRLLLGQLRNPIIVILLLTAGLSFFLHDRTDALIIIGIVLASAGLGYWQERGAANALRELLARVRTHATVLRDGRPTSVALEEVVPGDLLLLSAGCSIPGDGLILEAKDLYVVEGALTGETFPVEKSPGALPPATPIARRANSVFLGTHVASGTARVLVVHTGALTEFGRISARLRLRPPLTEFEAGIRRFGNLLAEVTFLLVLAIFAINVYFDRHVLDALLFSLALAVGLTPQLLPAVISVNLAHGARGMARANVIVKRLASIESLGSMTVLCSDKTGTLTTGEVRVRSAVDVTGDPSDRVLRFACLNAAFQSGFANPIDEAIREQGAIDLAGWSKRDEVPYDFTRKRLSVLVEGEGRRLIITKGAVHPVLSVCSHVELPDGSRRGLEEVRDGVEAAFLRLSREGFRTIGVAIREAPDTTEIHRGDEREMIFLGFVALHDPPKPGSAEAVAALGRQGVTLKIITGDNRLVSESLARRVGMPAPRVLTGEALRDMSDEALLSRARETDLFVEVEPNQKERILLSLKRAGEVVGFLGDGINDATALHAADVGISVDGAVDVAKESADIVLLEQDLGVLREGVIEGRRTFANTLKYVFMATSANFGNMFSMAGASLFLPFLPLLPKQILLMNVLTDLPEMAIASDRVDEEWVQRPHRWDIRFIRSFMVVFGCLSSLFDFLTFGLLWFALRATATSFRTGWFIESVLSASLVVMVVRTRGAAFSRRPGRALAAATAAVGAATLALPFLPVAAPLGLGRIPGLYYGAIGLIILSYIAAAELAKRLFYRRWQF